MFKNIILALLISLPFLWIPGDFMINGEDLHFMNYETFLNRAIFAWAKNFGYGDIASPVDHSLIFFQSIFYKILCILGINSFLIQKIYISFCILFLFSSFYLFSRIFTKNKLIFALSFGTYFFNFYTSGAFLYPAKIFQLILLPLLFWLTYKFLETQKKIYIALHFVFFFIFQSIFTNIAQLTALIFVYPLAIFFFKISHKNISLNKLLKEFFVFWFITIPIYFYHGLVWYFSVYKESSDLLSFNTFSAIHSSISRIFQFRGAWFEDQVFMGIPYNHWYGFYNSIPIVAISFLIIIIPLFVFLLTNQFKNNKVNFWLTSFLFFIALASGFSFFPNLYPFLFEHLVLLKIFREPWAKFMPLVIFSFSALQVYFLQIILRERKKISGLLLFFYGCLIFIRGYPFFSLNFYQKNVGFKQTFIKPPSYWWEYKDWSEKNSLKDINILPLPYPHNNLDMLFNWYGQGQMGNWNGPMAFVFGSTNVFLEVPLYNHPKVLEPFLKNKDFNFIKLGKLNYVLLQNDVEILENKDKYVWELEKINDYIGELAKQFGNKLFLYKVKDDYFLPHFYIPQNIIYSPNDIDALPEIVGLPGYELRSAIYLEPEIDRNTIGINRNKVETDRNMSRRDVGTKYAASPRNKEILERADEIFVKGERKDIGYWISDISKKESLKNGMPVPYVRWKPGSWEWKLARLKEKYEEWRVRKNPDKLIDKKLFYAGKRISEIEKYTPQSGAKYDGNIVEIYKKKMEETIEEIKKLRNLEIKGWEEQVIKVGAYWERHKEKIEERYRDIGLEGYRNWEGVFGELDEEIKGLEKRFDLENLEYSLEIPKEGKYKVYLKVPNSLPVRQAGKFQIPNKFQILPPSGGTPPKAVANSKFQIDGEEIGNELMVIDEKWLEVGKINLDKGKHKITLQLPPPENLVGENWQKLEEEATESGEIRLVSQGFFSKGENIVFQSIKDWEPGQLYYLSFEYRTEGGNLGVSVLEDKMVYKEEGEEIKTEKILDKKLRNWEIGKLGNWEKFERVLRADENTRGAKIYFYSLPEPNAFADVRFRNVKVYKLVQPKIVLRTIADNTDKRTWITPRITFVKINPTKYRVKVEGARGPYTLVFSESFHKGWKIYLRNWETEKLGNYGEIVASYFDGEIKEGTHKNIFLDKNTFETWGKKPIAEDRHYLVNGYANSWFITPEDVGGKENYELIVEFWPQRLFYIGLFISGITLIGCLGYLGWGKLRNWEIKKLRNWEILI